MLPFVRAQLPPPTRYLLDSVCRTDDAAPPPELAVPVSELVAEAQRQLVAGLLYRWAERNIKDDRRAELLARLAPLHQANVVHALKLVAETRELVSRLAAAGIPSIALKGPFLSKAYYGDYSIRHAGDVDLLLPIDRIAQADHLLRANGYRRTKPANELSAKRFELYLATQHEFGYVNAAGTVSVELHWRYADSPHLAAYLFADLRKRAIEHAIGRVIVPSLSHRDMLVHIAVHGAMDGWSRLKWIADIPRVLAMVSDTEVVALEVEARRMGHATILALALAVAVPMQSGDSPPRLAAPRILRRLAGEQPKNLLQKLRAYREDQRYFSAITDNGRVRRSLAYSNLIMPADFDRLPLPDAMTPALPFLAQCRRAYSYLRIGSS